MDTDGWQLRPHMSPTPVCPVHRPLSRCQSIESSLLTCGILLTHVSRSTGSLSRIALVSAVSMYPGLASAAPRWQAHLMQLTRMRCCAHSTASERAMCRTAASGCQLVSPQFSRVSGPVHPRLAGSVHPRLAGACHRARRYQAQEMGRWPPAGRCPATGPGPARHRARDKMRSQAIACRLASPTHWRNCTASVAAGC